MAPDIPQPKTALNNPNARQHCEYPAPLDNLNELPYYPQDVTSYYSESYMPTISMFYGIIVQMFWDEHAPPHFHAAYGEYKATIDIRALQIIVGRLPRRATQLVLDWAELHQNELLEDWDLCMTKQHPKEISPLK